jgi:hypothetical protein
MDKRDDRLKEFPYGPGCLALLIDAIEPTSRHEIGFEDSLNYCHPESS